MASQQNALDHQTEYKDKYTNINQEQINDDLSNNLYETYSVASFAPGLSQTVQPEPKTNSNDKHIIEEVEKSGISKKDKFESNNNHYVTNNPFSQDKDAVGKEEKEWQEPRKVEALKMNKQGSEPQKRVLLLIKINLSRHS